MVNFQTCVCQDNFIKLKKEMLTVMVEETDSPGDSNREATVDKDELMKDNIPVLLATLA